MHRPKRGKKAQQALSSADAEAALESIPEDSAPAAAAPRRPAAMKPADSDDETMDRGLSLMDRLAGQCALCKIHNCRRVRCEVTPNMKRWLRML